MSIKDIFTKDYYEKLKKKLTTKKNYRYLIYLIILILLSIACYEKFVIYRLEAEILKRDYSIRSLKEHNDKLNTIIEEGRMPSYLDKPDWFNWREQTMARKRLDSFIEKGLGNISDTLVLSERKETDIALNNLVTNYSKIASRNSNYPDVNEETTGYDIKLMVANLLFEEMVVLVYNFMSDSGRIDEHREFTKEFRSFKFKVMKFTIIGLIFVFFAVIIGTVVMSAMKGDMNNNPVVQVFIEIISKVSDILFSEKPIIE